MNNYSFDSSEKALALATPGLTLSLSIRRDVLRLDGGTAATCSIFIKVGKSDDPDFSITSHEYWSSTDMGDDLSRTVRLAGETKGFRLKIGHTEIRPIAFQERERLLAFLGELRGVELNYTPDIFGFLKKDGSDKEIKTLQPFPAAAMRYAD